MYKKWCGRNLYLHFLHLFFLISPIHDLAPLLFVFVPCLVSCVLCILCGYRDTDSITSPSHTRGCYSLPWRTPGTSWPTTPPPPASRQTGGYPGWTRQAWGSRDTASMCHTWPQLQLRVSRTFSIFKIYHLKFNRSWSMRASFRV